jgi:hypothetical protein
MLDFKKKIENEVKTDKIIYFICFDETDIKEGLVYNQRIKKIFGCPELINIKDFIPDKKKFDNMISKSCIVFFIHFPQINVSFPVSIYNLFLKNNEEFIVQIIQNLIETFNNEKIKFSGLISDGSIISSNVFDLLKIKEINKIDYQIKIFEEIILKKESELNIKINDDVLKKEIDDIKKNKFKLENEKKNFKVYHIFDWIHLLKNMRNNLKNKILYFKDHPGFFLRKLCELVLDCNIPISVIFPFDLMNIKIIMKMLDEDIVNQCLNHKDESLQQLGLYLQNMKKFIHLFENYDYSASLNLQNYFQNINLTIETSKQLMSTLTAIDEIKKDFPDLNIKNLFTNMVENFFSILKKKILYPNSQDIVIEASDAFEITKILINQNKTFSNKDDLVSEYYNLSSVNSNFYNFLENDEIFNNLLDNNIDIDGELSLEQKIFLNENKPEDHVLSIRSISTKTKMELYIPCLFVSEKCVHFQDFKIKKCLINHMIRVHNVKESIAKDMVLKVFKFALEKYERIYNEKKDVKYVVLLEQEIKPFYEELILQINQNKNENILIENKSKNNETQKIELPTQILEINEIESSNKENNETQILDKKRKRKNLTIKKTKKRRKNCSYANCKKYSIKNCEFCKNHCISKKIYCQHHKIKLTKENLKILDLKSYDLLFHDFEYTNVNKQKIIIDYSILKLKKKNFDYEILFNKLIFPRVDINYNSFDFKITKINQIELEKNGILGYELFQLLEKKLSNNIIFFSNNCNVEIQCLNSFFDFYLNKKEINEEDIKEYEKEKTLDLKLKLRSEKPKNFKNVLNFKKIIFIDTQFFFLYLDKNNPRSIEKMYKKTFNLNSYLETHRSFEDSKDLVQIFEKNFKNNFSNFYEKLEEFLLNSTKGIFYYNKLNYLK